MLLFELDAALFQLEEREPELDPSFQLLPRRAAFAQPALFFVYFLSKHLLMIQPLLT